MLKHTFCHLPGIGTRIEAHLWRNGVLTWEDLEASDLPHGDKKSRVRECLRLSFSSLEEKDPKYFANFLLPNLHWRLFPEFRNTAAYIDIETNGLMGRSGYITAITLYDGVRVRSYVRGLNLEKFADDIAAYRLLVTYNGKCFDIPFIEKDLDIRLTQAHIDLRYVLKGLGFSGGLKGCEKALGIDRGGLSGLDGYFAVLLWQDFLKTGSTKTLETLLAYNIMDTVNLENLLICSYNLSLRDTPFAAKNISMAAPPEPAFTAHTETIEKILRKNPWYAQRSRVSL